MNSKGMIRASSEGLKLAGPGGRSILLKAGSAETQGAYSLLKFTSHRERATQPAWPRCAQRSGRTIWHRNCVKKPDGVRVIGAHSRSLFSWW
jgi:hypothetical protein